MNIKAQKSEKKENGKQKQINIGGWIHAEIGSGGEEYMFSSYHGDIVIQKVEA